MQEEQTLSAVRFNTLVVKATAAGAAEIKRELKKVDGVEGIEKVTDSLEDAMDDAREALAAGSRTVGEAAELDEDELLEELEQELQLADATKQLTTVKLGGPSSGPAVASESDVLSLFAQVPHNVPVVQPKRETVAAQEQRELAELAQLSRSMVMEQPMPMPMVACH